MPNPATTTFWLAKLAADNARARAARELAAAQEQLAAAERQARAAERAFLAAQLDWLDCLEQPGPAHLEAHACN